MTAADGPDHGQVIRRVGGLEVIESLFTAFPMVIRRVGGLEETADS